MFLCRWKSTGKGVSSSDVAINGLAVTFPGNNEGWIVAQDVDVGTLAMPQLTMGCWVKSEGFNVMVQALQQGEEDGSSPLSYVLSSSHGGTLSRGFGIRKSGTDQVFF
jgi:hypothetical protein